MVDDENNEPGRIAEPVVAGNEQPEVSDYFPDEAFTDLLDIISQRPSSSDAGLDRLADVFSTNLVAAVLTASTLSVLARRTAYETGYMTMLGIAMGAEAVIDNLTEKVKQSLEDGPKETRALPSSLFVKAKQSLEEDLKQVRWKSSLEGMADSVSHDTLKRFIGDDHGRNTAGQIINQCAVLTWSSFEVLASDTFVYLLNRKPSLAGTILKDDTLKKYYRDKDLATSLEEYNFDLSCHMGDALIQQRRLDDLAAIKRVYEVIFPSSVSLREALSDAHLWRLYKTRNLIVHRAGVVDSFFRKETGDSRPIGTKLTVSTGDLKSFIILVAKAGATLLQTTADVLKEPPIAGSEQMKLPTTEES